MLLLAALVLAGWCGWFVLARVPVYVTSRVARLEVSETAHPVQVQVEGQVVASHVTLGRRVAAGEVLLELDASSWRLERDEAVARREGLERQAAALRDQLAAQKRTLEARRDAAASELREAQAAAEQARAAGSFAASKAARTDALLNSGGTSIVEAQEADQEARRRRGDTQAARLRVERLGAEETVHEAELDEERGRLVSELARLDTSLRAADVTVATLDGEIERRITRAPIAGRLGDVTPRPPGSHLDAGTTVAIVIPDGELRLVAEFAPADALGRVRAGQPARFRLDGFSWLEFGTVTATVTEVGSEASAGGTRIELRVPRDGERRGRVPLEHGLPGTVEVEIERVSPATLALRATGRMLGTETE